MKQAFFSKDQAAKAEHIRQVAASSKGGVIHLHPKNVQPTEIKSVYRTTYEDLNSRDVWLHVNSLLGDETVIILENPTRYPKITSPKFQHLQMLSHRCEKVYVVDIVPFTLDVKYIYATYAYLGRGILGYAHWYAFRENYQEISEDGRLVSCHDFDILAAKIKPVSDIDYSEFLVKNRDVFAFSSSSSENTAYQDKKTTVFAEEDSPQRIITQLADFAHAFKTRIDAVVQVAATKQGDTLIYTNLTTYAAKLNAALKAAGIKNAKATSYAKGGNPAQHLIYAESPIVKSYLLLDAEANSKDADSVTHILGDQKVDLFLFGRLKEEIDQINGFTKELHHAVRG